MNKDDVNNLANKFEDKYGSVDLMKVAFSSLTKALVKKQIVTELELHESFVTELESAIEFKKDVQ